MGPGLAVGLLEGVLKQRAGLCRLALLEQGLAQLQVAAGDAPSDLQSSAFCGARRSGDIEN